MNIKVVIIIFFLTSIISACASNNASHNKPGFSATLSQGLTDAFKTHSTPQNTAALIPTVIDSANLDNYKTITILPFTIDKNVNIANSAFVENFSAEIYTGLRFDHPSVFQEVTWNKSSQAYGDAIVTGIIRKYRPGNINKREFLIGWGAAFFEGEILVKDSKNGKILLSASFGELALGGGYERRSFQNLVTDTAVAISKTIFLWKQGQISR